MFQTVVPEPGDIHQSLHHRNVITLDVVLVARFRYGWDAGHGYFTGITFHTHQHSDFMHPTYAPDMESASIGDWNSHGWCDQTDKTWHHEGKKKSRADLRHLIRTRYLADSGDTDPAPTTRLDVVWALRHETGGFVTAEELHRIAVRRWPDIDRDLIPDRVTKQP